MYELFRYLDDHRRVLCVGSQEEQFEILSQTFSKSCRFGVIKLIINGHMRGQESGA